MIKLHDRGVYLSHQYGIIPEEKCANPVAKDIARKGTIARSILSAHNISGDEQKLKK